MSPKLFDYGILIKNVVASEISRPKANTRTVLLGTIAKIENVMSVEVFSVKFLMEDGETWEGMQFLVKKDAIVAVSKNLFPFLAAVNSPQERVKLSKDKMRSQQLMQIAVGSTVGYINFDDIVLATVKFIGKIPRLGKGFGLQLHEKNANSSCDGTHGGISYFKCPPGFAVFTTIERLVPYHYSSSNTEKPVLAQPSETDLNRMLEKNFEAFSISNGKGCDVNTFTNKNEKFKIQNTTIDKQGKETHASSSKLSSSVKTSSSLLDMLQKTSNQNNDFDHNTIIQPDDIRLMHQNVKAINQDHKREMDLVEVIGSDWSGNTNNKEFDPVRTSKKVGDKFHKSIFYTACPELKIGNDISNQPRIKSVNLINHLVYSKTVPRRNRSSSTQNNYISNEDEGTSLDRKQGETNIQINRLHCEDKVISTPTVQFTTPMPGTTNDLTIGSLVEISNDVSAEPLYGVIRWLGAELATKQVLVGVELEEEHFHLPLTLTDGTHNGQRYFKCTKNKGIFVPLGQCHKDSRFTDGTSMVLQNAPEEEFGKEMECPVIKGSVPPLCMPTEEDVEAVCGKFRGIQGHHNSCYLDATLFAMFTFTFVFDTLLYRPKGRDDIVCYEKVQQVLREEIVNPLRTNLFVRADRIMNLRKLLDQLSSVSGLTTEEKDPEEFLHSLLAQILKADPFLKLSSGQEAYHYQLFLEKEDNLTLPSVQHLFEQSFLSSSIKLKEVPSCLIIQMPRFGKNYKMYPRILPSQLLDVTDVIENSPRQCTVCGNLATWECTQCFGQCGVGLESTAFCTPCLEKAHTHNKRATHSPRKLAVSPDFSIMADHCTPPRLFMELFAVICIETSHYVAFVKCGVGHEAPWCFFDSMADRQGGQNGYNIPEMSACPDISKWLSDEQSCRLLHENAPSDRYLPEYARRLLCDAYICMYQSPDVMMYR